MKERIEREIALGNIKKALELIEKELKENPSDEIFYLKGLVFYHIGEREKAKISLEKAIEINPENHKALFLLGSILLETEKAKKALPFLKKATLIKEKAEYYNDLGYAYYQLKDYNQALKAFDKAIKLDSNLSDSYYNKALTLRKIGKYKESLKYYNLAISLNPDEPDYFYNKGIVLRLLGKPEKAVSSYKEAIKLKPDFVDAWNNLGNAFYDIGKLNEALKAYKKAVEIEPSYSLGWQNIGNVYLDLGEYKQAVKAFEKAIRYNTKCAECFMDMGIAFKELGLFEEALKSYQQAIELNPEMEALSEYNKACLYASKGEKEKAIQHLKKAFSFDISLKNYAKTDKDLEFIKSDLYKL